MSKLDIQALFEAGAHFGHKTSRWHPKMRPYIHSARGGIHVINLEKTVNLLSAATDFLTKTVAASKPVLLVGTNRQAQELVTEAAKDTGMPYVNARWFGGMLTNYKTMQQRVKRLKDLESRMASGELASRYNKLEVQKYQEEIDKLNHDFGGIKDMPGQPGAVFVLDAVHDATAVKEAAKLGIPVVAVVDSNADPSLVDYPIPANDDAIRALKLIMAEIVAALKEGAAAGAKLKADQDAAAAKEAAKTAKASAGKQES